ncbi:MAG: hypothetical protein KatS3mg111_0815 [Pirellulaceae bacterium]|nr:MAG: hypothetical protein KatS3mg111_0815 [Pirellulaceae bacterium]
MVRQTEKPHRTTVWLGFLQRSSCVRMCGRPVHGILAMVFGIWLAASAYPQQFDSFEGGQPRWQLVESDCQAQLVEHAISPIYPRNGQTCELLQVACAQGTYALIAYPIEPCLIVDDFQPEVWARCSSSQLQLGVRVVFPHAVHPTTQSRLTTTIWGSTYDQPGKWQALRVIHLERSLHQEVAALRQRFGRDLDLEGAFIDCLVMNVYAGPGRYRVQLDDLRLSGMVPMASVGVAIPNNWHQRWQWRQEVERPQATAWNRPLPPQLWIQHRGEALPWLASLGIDGIVTDRLTADTIAEAVQTDLAVIAPPPEDPTSLSADANRIVYGWFIGAALDRNLYQLASQQVARGQALPSSWQRPTVAESLEDLFRYARLVDHLIVPCPSGYSPGSEEEKQQWLDDRIAASGLRGASWVSIPIHPPTTLIRQVEVASQRLAPDFPVEEALVDAWQLRHSVTMAMHAGARAILFRTNEPLEFQDAADSVRAAAVRWISREAELWRPWQLAGTRVAPPTVNWSSWKASAWALENSQLVVATLHDPTSWYTSPEPSSPLRFTWNAAPPDRHLLRISHGKLERLEPQWERGQATWEVESPAAVETFVFTSDPVPIRYLQRHLRETAAEMAADMVEVVASRLSLASRLAVARARTQGRRGGSPFSPGAETSTLVQRSAARALPSLPTVGEIGQLQRIEGQLERARQALQRRNNDTAIKELNHCLHETERYLHRCRQEAMAQMPARQSSPFTAALGALELHWLLVDACQRSQWHSAELPGGKLDDLHRMMQAGWSQQVRLTDEIETRVELVPAADTSGKLRLAAYARQAAPDHIPGGYEGTSIRIRSAPISVTAGQLVRARATARVLRMGTAPGTGVLVFDNQLGPGIGMLVRGQPGETIPIDLYRLATEDGEFRILAECRGHCDLLLEDLQLDVIVPARNGASYPTAVMDAVPEAAPQYPPVAAGPPPG